MVPHKTPYLFKYLWPQLIWRVPNVEKTLFLTFDDGPIPELTNWVLETLAQFNAKATFFCVGENVKNNPQIFLEIIKNGHAIGNHTFNHLNGLKVRPSEYEENINLCDQVFREFGLESDLFRPPYGRLNYRQRKKLGDRKVVMWDVLTKDYDQKLEADKVLKGSIKATQSGSIIVFHDNLKAERNLKSVLPRYLEYFISRGYRFESL